MQPAIVDIDPDARIVQDAFVGFMKMAGGLENRAGKISDVHAFYARVKRGSFGGVADAKADYQDAGWMKRQQQRDMRKRTHVPLVEKRRRRHRMTVRHQASAAARYFGDGDHFR